MSNMAELDSAVAELRRARPGRCVRVSGGVLSESDERPSLAQPQSSTKALVLEDVRSAEKCQSYRRPHRRGTGSDPATTLIN